MNAILELRKKVGLTQTELAKSVGVTQPTVSQWEKGTSMPATGKLQSIANALGCDVGDILRGNAG